MIDATDWTEEQIQDFLKLQEAGLIDENGLTSKGRALILGTLGNPPEIDFSQKKEAA